jgi:hypothetical protein
MEKILFGEERKVFGCMKIGVSIPNKKGATQAIQSKNQIYS